MEKEKTMYDGSPYVNEVLRPLQAELTDNYYRAEAQRMAWND